MHLIVNKTNNGTKNRLHAKYDLLLYYFDVGFSLCRSILVIISDVNCKPNISEYQRKWAKYFINSFFIIVFSKIIFKHFHLIKTYVF